MRRMLLAAGHTVAVAEDGEAAWKVLADPGQRIEMGIFDVMMPRLDGIDLLERIRRTPGLRSMPVILCTAANDRSTVERAGLLSVTQYIVKPYSKTLVLEKIQLIATELAAGSPIEETATVAARLGVEAADLSELIKGLVNDLNAWLGATASAYQRTELRRLALAANGLKGSCLNLGLRQLARELEFVERAFTEEFEERYRLQMPPSPSEIRAAVNGVSVQLTQVESRFKQAA